MNKEQLLDSPFRPHNQTNRQYAEIYLIPNGEMHESGFGYISIIGAIKELALDVITINGISSDMKYELCGSCDDISCFFPMIKGDGYEFPTVRMDCLYLAGVLRYHGRSGYFTVSDALSSMDITFHSIK